MAQTDDAADPAGPAMTDTVYEVQGSFPDDATLQDALARLALLGFDRADFSLPPVDDFSATPEAAAPVQTPQDSTQIRTMNSGITGASVGTVVAAVLATGGAAAPVAIAAAGLSALGATAAASGIGLATGSADTAKRDELGAAGKLVLAARVSRPDQTEPALDAMRQAGARDVRAVIRRDEPNPPGVDSTAWTG